MIVEETTLKLVGTLDVEQAESLLETLLQNPSLTKIDVSDVTHLHAAVLQVCLASGLTIGLSEDASLNQVFAK